MDDSRDIFGDSPPWDNKDEEDAAPSAAELEAAGQSSMFGEPEPAPPEPEPTAAELEAAGQSAMFGEAPAAAPQPAVAPAPASPPAGTPSQPYRVLARKYRPQTFGELIGQEAMVQTLANAIKRDRLAHAFLMTGVRGVGKTSTARLIAKALNCIGPDGQGGPTIDPCGQCEPCLAIAEGRHIDVIEMDAASHTGVDDVREIIEAVRYAAVSARYKIYIIDEVHMLSRNAFNALLKTLEEPPAHVKFLFATTEVDKLPVTVLSRCQRFDLRRIPTPMLAEHFARVCGKEGVEAEEEALAMVAAAAEGSVRDGLSILDQAIAHADLDGEGKVRADKVRDMLGLSDKSVQRKLLAAILDGKGAELLDLVAHQFALGVEPIAMLRGLMELTHRVAVAQVSGSAADAPSSEEREALEGWAKALRAGQLHRLWQLLLKGHDEVKSAPDPLVAAQMALLRIMHAADMPDPGSLVKKLEELASRAPAAAPAGEGGAAAPGAPSAAAPTAIAPRWEALVDDVEHLGQPVAANVMRMQVRVVELAPGVLRYTQPPGFNEDISGQLRSALGEATGDRWQVERVNAEGAPTLVEQAEAKKAADTQAVRGAPLVEATLAAFPGAELIEDDRPAAIGGGSRNWRR
ncbi:DNA polymerase III subunit gamma/tau [Novosphingobium mangrovi (ex Huang et al. 2023)]|uniref:DNA polymerase III subunit gamma/tau n=1 Tax=Novosphingobium mangrovi (ex Huang et al. 2023) TaxID=2976432 RepID=A0ABT2I6E6_9SPHN|nr:DNA polymerase III subunit gamma/tau [Novosphingobium mangrovi (ex Huang et al. 2023)]MCT2400387.1 DNA polymerase III subunit gamma/tau [Novosphingobium mangrovi (ex Huang et al. 2023)]